MKFGGGMVKLVPLLLWLYIASEPSQGQRIFRPATLSKFGSYAWKFPTRSAPQVEVNLRSSYGNVRDGMNADGASRGKPISPELDTFGGIGYVPGFAGDTNMLKLAQSNDIDSYDPPPHDQVAKMARFIVSRALWTSLATISSRGATTGSPFTTILSVSDGTRRNSTGNLYLYMTPLDLAAIDLDVNSNASLVLSLAQTKYCQSHKYDPEDPRCAMVSFTGRIVKIPTDSDEEKFGKAALFYKHPVMKTWPQSHKWYVAKLDIGSILVRDYFGGARDVNMNDYFAANPN